MKILLSLFLLLAVSSFGAVPAYTSFRGAGGITIVSNPPVGTIIIDGSGVVASGTNSSMQVSTNNVASSTMASNINFTAGNNTVLKGTNIGSTAHINYGMASNLSFYSSLGTMVLGTWDGRFGFSNAATASMSAWIEESDTGNEWQFAGQVSVTNIVLTAIPGTGTNLGITAGGTLFRTTTTGGSDTNIGVGQTIYLDKTFGVDATASRTNLLRPFQTPSNSVAAILSGDTLVVRAGAYPVNPKADAAGEAGNWNHQAGLAFTNLSNIRIVGEPGSVWYMSSWRSNNLKFSCPMIHLERCTNVTFEGLTLIGLRTDAVVPNPVVLGQGGLMMHHCSDITIKSCTFSNWPVHAISWPTDVNGFDRNSGLRVYNSTFANIGGTNHITLQMDGTAIAVGGNDMEIVENYFFNNLRDIEYCCDEDTRRVKIRGNTSRGCYFQHIMLTGTNTSEVIIEDNIVIGYTSFLIPGASADSSTFIVTYAGSNVLVKGNIVKGFAGGIVSSPTAGTKTVDWLITENLFVDFSGYPIAMPSPINNMVGRDVINERNMVVGNYFMNCASLAVVLNGNNSAVNDNTFIDCNLGAFPQGVVSIGWPTAGVATNSANISIVQNKLISSAANAGPGIVIYGMSSSNTVHGNEIDRKFATNIHNLGVGTRTRPVNLVAAGSLLRSDTNGNERAVVFGSGVAWDGSTGTLTGTGGGSGTQNIQTNGIPVSDSATGTVYFAGQNIQHFATNASGRVSMLTRTPTNLTFLNGAGYDMRLGWFIDDAGGAVNGTGTNFGFYDVSSDQLLLWTHGTGGDVYFKDDLFAPNMDGVGEVVVKAGLGKLQVTNVVNLSNINVATLFVTNGIPAAGAAGDVQYNVAPGVLGAEAAFNYDAGDDTLSVGSVIAAAGVNSQYIITSIPGSAIAGVTNGGNAAAGIIGEYRSSTFTNRSVAATGDFFDATNIVLAAGDWDVTAIMNYNKNGATFTYYFLALGISTTTGNSDAGLIAGDNYATLSTGVNDDSTTLVVPSYRVNTPTNITLYMKGNIATYSVATPQVNGRISARRVR